MNRPPFVILNGVKSAAPRWVRRILGYALMPNWALLLLVCSSSLGLRARPKWNVNAIAIGATVIVSSASPSKNISL